ncbi:MAG: hypothetical protein A3A73_04825 [Omnitrophica bacterium RIFCSPLOWO2_01_FULL_50_24]|nr:MAG: hypothetical protein A3A73_04825 [Omnitrophica bacterium RIFCSPLOWO2_01_FULL_50_24]
MYKAKDIAFQKLLVERGLKYTYERRCIYDEILGINKHFDAEKLYGRFKKRGDRISRATVYRTIPLLLEAGVIQKSAGDGKGDFFEKTALKGHHDHMICMECGTIIEFQCDRIEKAQNEMCAKHKFQPSFHDHRIFGLCAECR